ncbi:sigma factor [Streptosporangium roseum]|uniref:sigma factor n=1 Tax=Streptosporangium roseum TaxID=2001 RepID=UPI0004CD59C7|nr:sigma factor [Streptosporangium roseum]
MIVMVQTRHPAEIMTAIEQTRPRPAAFVAARIAPADDPEEIVQEVLIRISQSIGTLRGAERMEAWIYQITRNAIADHRRAAAACTPSTRKVGEALFISLR